MAPSKTVIVGWDMVSPLGTDMAVQWAQAARGASGVGPLTRFERPEGFPVAIAGQVPDWDASPYPFLAPRQMAHWTSPIFRTRALPIRRIVPNRPDHGCHSRPLGTTTQYSAAVLSP